jgi:hypothetical protein
MAALFFVKTILLRDFFARVQKTNNNRRKKSTLFADRFFAHSTKLLMAADAAEGNAKLTRCV